ncbi:MAG: dihydroorotate dehydrogenase [Christensenellales bacterium]
MNKPDLSVSVCGVPFQNPVIAASGCFGFGQEMAEYVNLNALGGISIKGLTPKPRLGNPAPRIAETPSGMLNSVGLQNPGIDAFLEVELPRLAKLNCRILANVAGSSVEDYAYMTEKLANQPVDMVELNISCPNVKEGGVAFGVYPDKVYEVVSAAKAHCTQPLVVKLTPNTADITATALAAEKAGADAISLINTLTGMAVDFRARRPILANVTGGLSGPAVKPVALRMVYQVAQAVNVPVIGMGGIDSGLDALEFMLCGASAVQVGMANLYDPYACVRIAEEMEQILAEEGLSSVQEIIGQLRV